MVTDGGVRLLSSAPNPFRSSTQLMYSLVKDGRANLSVYDLQGRLVRTLLLDAEVASGDHVAVWDGRNEFGTRATPGIYFFRLQSAGYTTAKSIVLAP
jgi:flagellar hook assembly protein FlgD